MKPSPIDSAKSALKDCVIMQNGWIKIARSEYEPALRSQAVSIALMKRKHANEWRSLIKELESQK